MSAQPARVLANLLDIADVTDAWYAQISQIDSPSTAGIERVDCSTNGGGVVHVRFADQGAFVAWARYLGFDLQQQPRGRALLCSASGNVQHRGRTYRIQLAYTRFSDGGAA